MTEILDAEGTTIVVGQIVVDRAGQEIGKVTQLTEPDADYDDELQRAVQYGPYVYVSYYDGTDDRYLARWNATGPWDDTRDDFTCDDVIVRKSGEA